MSLLVSSEDTVMSTVNKAVAGCVELDFVDADDKVVGMDVMVDVSWVFSVTEAIVLEVDIADKEKDCIVVCSSCVREVC